MRDDKKGIPGVLLTLGKLGKAKDDEGEEGPKQLAMRGFIDAVQDKDRDSALEAFETLLEACGRYKADKPDE